MGAAEDRFVVPGDVVATLWLDATAKLAAAPLVGGELSGVLAITASLMLVCADAAAACDAATA